VPTTLAGVKQLMRALGRSEAVGLLPDQVPAQGQGVWAPFFGRPAYTMTLAARLMRCGEPTVLLAWGERLPWGRGYVVHLSPFDVAAGGDTEAVCAAINRAMESVIRRCPEQYLWAYNRYKPPLAGDAA
jgi:KDO2-lipid IV(A) lauroyltransferase